MLNHPPQIYIYIYFINYINDYLLTLVCVMCLFNYIFSGVNSTLSVELLPNYQTTL